jgi:hypothetical protein
MESESRRQRLIDALRHLTPEMKETLRERKEEGLEQKDRPDFVWHSLLQSFATMGNARGWDGLIGNEVNYHRVTFEALSGLDRIERLKTLDEVLRASKVRMPSRKATWLDLNYQMIVEMGGPAEARRQALAQDGREGKVAFLQRFHGIGDKYARNIWMDVYHPAFRDAIAVDERIKRVTEALGTRLRTMPNTSASTRRSRGKSDSKAGRSTACSITTRASSWRSSEPAERSGHSILATAHYRETAIHRYTNPLERSRRTTESLPPISSRSRDCREHSRLSRRH